MSLLKHTVFLTNRERSHGKTLHNCTSRIVYKEREAHDHQIRCCYRSKNFAWAKIPGHAHRPLGGICLAIAIGHFLYSDSYSSGIIFVIGTSGSWQVVLDSAQHLGIVCSSKRHKFAKSSGKRKTAAVQETLQVKQLIWRLQNPRVVESFSFDLVWFGLVWFWFGLVLDGFGFDLVWFGLGLYWLGDLGPWPVLTVG